MMHLCNRKKNFSIHHRHIICYRQMKQLSKTAFTGKEDKWRFWRLVGHKLPLVFSGDASPSGGKKKDKQNVLPHSNKSCFVQSALDFWNDFTHTSFKQKYSQNLSHCNLCHFITLQVSKGCTITPKEQGTVKNIISSNDAQFFQSQTLSYIWNTTMCLTQHYEHPLDQQMTKVVNKPIPGN